MSSNKKLNSKKIKNMLKKLMIVAMIGLTGIANAQMNNEKGVMVGGAMMVQSKKHCRECA